MVKRKEEPKRREKAGFAARTEVPVKDATAASASNSTRNDKDEENGDESNPEEDGRIEIKKDQTEPRRLVANAPQKLLMAKKATKDNTAAVNQAAKVKKKAKPGAKALLEIKRLQKTTDLCIPRAPFVRIVREVIFNATNNPTYRITEAAVEALREASESLLISVFEDSYLLAIHAKRVTLLPRDISLLLRIRNDMALTQV